MSVSVRDARNSLGQKASSVRYAGHVKTRLIEVRQNAIFGYRASRSERYLSLNVNLVFMEQMRDRKSVV